MEIKHLLGANVRRLRESMGWSQDKLSEKSGLHRTYISGIERGIRNPTISIVDQVARSLNVTVSALFKE
jgi:transcriptional regulator with XRE-family HTH domain